MKIRQADGSWLSEGPIKVRQPDGSWSMYYLDGTSGNPLKMKNGSGEWETVAWSEPRRWTSELSIFSPWELTHAEISGNQLVLHTPTTGTNPHHGWANLSVAWLDLYYLDTLRFKYTRPAPNPADSNWHGLLDANISGVQIWINPRSAPTSAQVYNYFDSGYVEIPFDYDVSWWEISYSGSTITFRYSLNGSTWITAHAITGVDERPGGSVLFRLVGYGPKPFERTAYVEVNP